MRCALTGPLVEEFRNWTVPRKLTSGDAMELLHDPRLTLSQREWLSDFVRRWEVAQRKEDRFVHLFSVPIKDEAGAMAFLQAMVDARMEYHLEDSPDDVVNIGSNEPIFTPEEAALVSARVAEIYALPIWSQESCPIGRMMQMEAEREGFACWEDLANADVKSVNFGGGN